MLYEYTAATLEGEVKTGSIEASNVDIAINALQAKGLVITDIKSAKQSGSVLESLGQLKFFNKVKRKDIVILSRQLATLFEAKITMIRSGEESGKLEEIFATLADHMERSYELSSKTRNALIYPAFVAAVFFIVMTLMLTLVVPKLAAILSEVNQEIPFYTKILIGAGNFFNDFKIFLFAGAAMGGIFLWRYSKTEKGNAAVSRFQTSFPFVGVLYSKFYLSRMTDSMETLLSSGVPAVRTMEIATR